VLPFDLCKNEHSAFQGRVTPIFYDRSGEVPPLPQRFEEAIRKITAVDCCVGCKHTHVGPYCCKTGFPGVLNGPVHNSGITELHFPNISRMTLHNNNSDWEKKLHSVGFDSRFSHYFYSQFHHIGVLWTPTDIVYEVDGEPVSAIRTNSSIHGKTDIRFSTALMDYAGKIPDHPEGHHMYVKLLRVLPLH
jgi:hypothetical protein